jgi:hypothetical protein
MNKKKILIVEAHNFHEEVVKAQLDLIDSKYELFLALNEDILKKGLQLERENQFIIKSKNRVMKFITLIELFFWIRSHKFDIIIFNTVEDRFTKLLSAILPEKIKKVGIIHDLDNYRYYGEHINNFLVLSKKLFENLHKKISTDKNIHYFYPLIYSLKEQLDYTYYANKEDAKIEICIPGKIEYSRRDYAGLVGLASKLKNPNIKFILLGNITKDDGPKIYDMIKKKKLENRFEYFENFIPYDLFFKKIYNSDILFPLLTKKVKNYQKYKESKITAIFNLAYLFKKPLLLPKELAGDSEFKNFAISYEEEYILSVLDNITDYLNNMDKNKMLNDKRFDKKLQQKSLFSFLENLI